MGNDPSLQKTSQTRIWIIADRAGPSHVPTYQGRGRATGLTWPQGDVTPIRAPSPDESEKFLTVDTLIGQQGLPSLTTEFRLTRDLSDVLKLVRKGCPVDLQLHAGACKEPTNFNKGWEKVYVLENARATDYGTSDLGALSDDQNAVSLETVPWSGDNWFEIARLIPAELGETEIAQEIIAVVICDSASCGACGIASDGCQKVFALTLSAGGSPGLPAEVIYSPDAGMTLGDTNITTLPANRDPSDMACVGIHLVVISNMDDALHYAELADILNAAETWARVGTGFVGAGSPNAIFSVNSIMTWIVGDGGYIYFTSDPTTGVVVQNAGVATIENLNDVHFINELNGVAVGAANAVVVTANGGATWSAITGPAPAVVLNCVWMKSRLEWFVGTAGGELYYTVDGGVNWTAKAFPGSGAGQVREISFATNSVGYMAHDTATPAGRILRTIDGGYTWYVLPEETGTMPANDRINALAACEEDVNLVYGGGLADDAIDGILVKASA